MFFWYLHEENKIKTVKLHSVYLIYIYTSWEKLYKQNGKINCCKRDSVYLLLRNYIYILKAYKGGLRVWGLSPWTPPAGGTFCPRRHTRAPLLRTPDSTLGTWCACTAGECGDTWGERTRVRPRCTCTGTRRGSDNKPRRLRKRSRGRRCTTSRGSPRTRSPVRFWWSTPPPPRATVAGRAGEARAAGGSWWPNWLMSAVPPSFTFFRHCDADTRLFAIHPTRVTPPCLQQPHNLILKDNITRLFGATFYC